IAALRRWSQIGNSPSTLQEKFSFRRTLSSKSVASLSRQATTRPSESLGTALNRIDRQMTEFATNLRRRCRNPKCCLKLPKPVSNEREAFCCRGCYRSFLPPSVPDLRTADGAQDRASARLRQTQVPQRFGGSLWPGP